MSSHEKALKKVGQDVKRKGSSAIQDRGDIKSLHHFKHTKKLSVNHHSRSMSEAMTTGLKNKKHFS